MTTKIRTAAIASTGTSRSKRPATLMGRVLTFLSIARERQTLASLDDHILRDIGKTRDDVHREAKRPAWDAPDRWLR